MTTENVRALVAYRLGQSDESIEAAEVLLEKGLMRPCINRAYYAMFYAVLALLAMGKQETSRHSGAVSLFDRDFVKEGLFPKEFSKWLHDAFELRQRSDYAPQQQVSRDEAAKTLENAVSFNDHPGETPQPEATLPDHAAGKRDLGEKAEGAIARGG